jgi:DoxX-like family
MNPKLKKLAVPMLRWTLGLVVLIESLQEVFAPTAIQEFARTGLPQWVRLVLGGSEIIAAVIFIAPFTTVIGGYALIVIFGFAAALHLMHGQYDIGALFVYGMAALVGMTNRDCGLPEVAHDRQ